MPPTVDSPIAVHPLITGATIAAICVAAFRDSDFTSDPGYCQQFAREVAERTGGVVAERMDQYRQGSALATMGAFGDSPYNIWERSSGLALPTIQEGDFLYKGRLTSGPFGHVGIALNGRRVGLPGSVVCVGENSSYHMDPDNMGDISGAKGFRTLEAFGPFEMLVRLI